MNKKSVQNTLNALQYLTFFIVLDLILMVKKTKSNPIPSSEQEILKTGLIHIGHAF